MSSPKSNTLVDKSNNKGPVKLAAYRDAKSTAIIAASLLIPFGTVAFFVLFCQGKGGEYALDASVRIGHAQRVALIIQGLYFMLLPFGFELMIEKLPFPRCPSKYRFGKVPSRPDNLYWMMSMLER